MLEPNSFEIFMLLFIQQLNESYALKSVEEMKNVAAIERNDSLLFDQQNRENREMHMELKNTKMAIQWNNNNNEFSNKYNQPTAANHKITHQTARTHLVHASIFIMIVFSYQCTIQFY